MEDIKAWMKAASVRAVKTVAQTAVATIGVSAVMTEVDWMLVASTSLLAGIISVLTSLAGLPEVDNGADIAKLAQAKHAKIGGIDS